MLIRTNLEKERWQWKGYHRADAEIPRKGDRAEVVEDCCRQFTGLVVKVIGDPHHCVQFCADCGTPLVQDFVEVEPQSREKPLFAMHKGPFFMPVGWLRRVR